MKYLIFTISLWTGAMAFSQDTAMDWTRVACGTSREHHLYSELDSGYVVIIEIMMANCSPCVVAANGVKNVMGEFSDTHPDRIRLYSVGFNEWSTCSLMLEWAMENGFKHPIFEKGQEETAYYGGIGMPTLVIAGGGTQHKVYYEKFGYSSADDPSIRSALSLALSESSSTALEIPADNGVLHVYPNPAEDLIQINYTNPEATHFTVTESSGKIVATHNLSGTFI